MTKPEIAHKIRVQMAVEQMRLVARRLCHKIRPPALPRQAARRDGNSGLRQAGSLLTSISVGKRVACLATVSRGKSGRNSTLPRKAKKEREPSGSLSLMRRVPRSIQRSYNRSLTSPPSRTCGCRTRTHAGT
jgi:hypothetical protein